MEPDLIGHSSAICPVAVDLNCFELYLLGYSAAECVKEHIERLVETHKLPPSFFAESFSPPAPPAVRSPVKHFESPLAAAASASATPVTTFRLPPQVLSEADTLTLAPLTPQLRNYLLQMRRDPSHLTQWFNEQLQFFRTLENDEGYFAEPAVFTGLVALPLHPSVRRALVQRYYAVHDAVLMRCLGRRLTKAEIDEVVDHYETVFAENWVRRQCENLRRVHKVIVSGYRKRLQGVERGAQFEPRFPCRDAIQETFEIAREQTRVYAIATFLAEHQLNVEPFTHLSLDRTLVLAEATMESWCAPNNLLLNLEYQASIGILSKVLNDAVCLRDLCGGLGATATVNPMLVAMSRLRTVGPASAMELAGAVASSPPPASAPAADASGQLAASATASIMAATPPVPSTPLAPKWRFSQRLQEDILTLIRSIARIARQLSVKDDLVAVFKLIYGFYLQFVKRSSPSTSAAAAADDATKHEPHEVIGLLGLIAHQVVLLRAVPQPHHAHIQSFFVVIKLCLQLLIAPDS